MSNQQLKLSDKSNPAVMQGRKATNPQLTLSVDGRAAEESVIKGLKPMTPVFGSYREWVFFALQGVAMRTSVFLLALLAAFSFLTVYFSFWIAFGLVYCGSMLLVVLLAYAERRKQFTSSAYKSLQACSEKGGDEPTFATNDML